VHSWLALACITASGCQFHHGALHDAALADGTADAPVDVPVDAQQGSGLVQQVTAASEGNTQLSATLTAAPASGHLLVMVGSAVQGPLMTVSGGGATWTMATRSTIHANVEIWYGITDGSSSAVTITFTTITGQMWMSVSEWSGLVASSVVDKATATSGTSNPAASGSITTTNARDLLIFGVGDRLPNTFGAPTGGPWTAMDGVTTTMFQQALCYRHVTATGTFAPTLPETGGYWDAGVVAFREP
jgi:hypothetical protein